MVSLIHKTSPLRRYEITAPFPWWQNWLSTRLAIYNHSYTLSLKNMHTQLLPNVCKSYESSIAELIILIIKPPHHVGAVRLVHSLLNNQCRLEIFRRFGHPLSTSSRRTNDDFISCSFCWLIMAESFWGCMYATPSSFGEF